MTQPQLDKKRIDHCLLLAISMKQSLELVSDEDAPISPVVADYYRNVCGFLDYTMDVLSSMPDRERLRIVE